MRYSPYCQYAIQALAFLASAANSGPSRSCEIAASTGVPQHTLTKVMIELRRANLVRAIRGPGGGFELSRPAAEITCGDILDAFNCKLDLGLLRVDMCMLGFKHCNSDFPCALHSVRKKFEDDFKSTMSKLTVDKLTRHIHRISSNAKGDKSE